jgi:hypothetical protein
MEGQNSPARSMALKLNDGEEVSWAGLVAALGPCGTMGPAGKEGEAVRRNLRGGCCGSRIGVDGGSPVDQQTVRAGNMQGGGGLIYTRDRRTDGNFVRTPASGW